MLNDVRTFVKLNYRNQWLEELRMTRKQNSTELSRTMLTQEVPEVHRTMHRAHTGSDTKFMVGA